MNLPVADFLTALFSIIIIDLVLAGDNAIVIGLACRNLPKHMQLKGIILGTLGAIVIRIIATLAVVWLLKIQGLMLSGGILLIYIAYKLSTKQTVHNNVKCQDSLLGAVATVIVADAVMGVDNVLAVAGASHGNSILVVIGLLISIPIMVFGSTIIIKLMDNFPFIITLGSGIIAYTAGKMITEEPFLHNIFVNPVVKYTLILLIVFGVISISKYAKNASLRDKENLYKYTD
ncbi:MAG: hypothetical protein APF84_02435 [Gracilibacter sp. BRH_c7a]|nr:MAG: hypothetical protein APF84_02435 [Gracilibacter sp. BRH_c7a]